MTHMTEVNFADFQMEERYKKLERTLKLASLRQENRTEDVSWPLLTSPSISSINADPFDSTTNIPSLQVSKIDSEVVSSSNNLRNILLKKKGINSNHKMIATSSVKKFREENDCLKDRLMMPPPNFNNHFCIKKKLNSLTSPNAKSLPRIRSNSSDIDIESPKKKGNHRFSSNDGNYIDSFVPLQISCDNFENKNVRMFTKWKVMLNEQNELVIKGKIECGKVAQSKPIVRRLTSTKIVSVFKHLYHLQGNIVDDEYELPDYVRGKFYSGFPDDWENVYQIWRTFVQQGYSATFRWPTPITDSDDDLRSEITDITFVNSKSPKDKRSNLTPFEEFYASEASVNLDCTYNILQTKEKQNFNSHSCQKSDSFTQTCLSDTIKNSPYREVSIQSLKNQYGNDKENINLNCTKTTVNSLKDKLNVIVNNLTNKNCDEECVGKIIEIFDCLNYVVSYGTVKYNGSNIENSKLKGDKHIVEERYNGINDKSQNWVESESISLQHPVNSKVANYNNSSQRKRTFAEMSKNNDISTSDSENEIYVGVPRIPINRIIRQKDILLKPCKRRIRKKTMYQKHDDIEKQHISNAPSIMSDNNNGSYIKTIRSEKVNVTNFNDSSISIIEDERAHLKVKGCISSNIQNNVDKYVKSDIMEREQWGKPNDFTEIEDTHEIQKHSVQQNSTVINKPINYLQYSNKNTTDNDPEFTVAKKCNNTMTQTNSYLEENRHKNDQYQNHSSCQQYEELLLHPKNTMTEMTKPVVISSVPIDIKIRNTQLHFLQDPKVNVIKDENKAIKDLNEKVKNRNLTKKKSPMKSNVISITNSNLLSDSTQYSEECSNIQSSNVDPIILKKSLQDNLKVSRDNKFVNNCKPKLLSAWTPNILSKSGLHLIFEGKLLNEVGHIIHRKFKTDIIFRRVSQKLVETIHHEFYQLIGDLNDTKHVVPKELVNQCRYGCPTNIEQFCEIWKSLENADITDSVHIINVGVSSKGRRIIPPLSYWRGERVVLKDNNPVYNPGTSQNSLIVSPHKSSAKSNDIKRRKNRSDSSKKNHLDILAQNVPTISPEKLVKSTKNNTKLVGHNRPTRIVTRSKRKALQEVSESSVSSDGKNISAYENQKMTFNSGNIISKDDVESINAENLHESHINLVTTKPTKIRSNARKDIEPNTSLSTLPKQILGNQPSAGKYRDVVYTYYQDVAGKNDILSDDQVSHV
ncbi:metacaspase-2-like isoform X1 [Bombus flavifrons]|uniref:metacaspase-2-like isoform X1 n=1 Tax=Bombus flavifrons TaxID=103934 RepID=UPI003703EB5B